MDLKDQFQSEPFPSSKPLKPRKKNQSNPSQASIYDDAEDEEIVLDQNLTKISRPQYGNMKVLYNKSFLITLGPDYWCFLPTFIVFNIVSVLTIRLVFSTTENAYLRAASFFISIGQCVAYLMVATSNPGLVMDPQTKEKNPTKRYCKRCGFQVPKSARHCQDCDMCIEGYDHHCPWTSKCIGKNNLVRFYVFLAWTPIFLIYTIIACVFCLTDQLNHVQKLPVKLF